MKYTFFEALAIVVGTKRRIKTPGSLWFYYHNGNRRLDTIITDECGPCWWPSIEEQKAQIWEIEPEMIYVWGACDEDGYGSIYKNKPIKTGDDWFGSGTDDHLKNMFPKDKPQKFKLVLVEG